MEFKVEKLYQSAGVFADPNTGKQIAYDNHYVVLVAYNEDGSFKKGLFPKIKTTNIPANLAVGDYVKVYYNEYKALEALTISRKGDNK